MLHRTLTYTSQMDFPNKPAKFFILDGIRKMLLKNPLLRILDIGSGQSRNFVSLLREFPLCTYVGVEPCKKEYIAAERFLAPYTQARVINGFADTRNLGQQFDIAVSLSVLEHIKYLHEFFAFAARHTATGGKNIHLYDLGHALYPCSLQERLHVLMCRLPLLCRLVPRSYWTSYLSPGKAKAIAEGYGFSCDEITYHNCPNHVEIIKAIKDESEAHFVLQSICALERIASNLFNGTKTRKEMLFPSIALWFTKS